MTFFISFFKLLINIGFYLKKFGSWFSQDKMDYPPDESGELMRRFMAKKSWFDHLSMAWVEQPFWGKIAYITGTSLVFGLIGIPLAAPLFLSISVCVLAFLIHGLFVAHILNRREAAKIFAEESMDLNQSLKQTDAFLKEATDKVNGVAETLTCGAEKITSAATLLSTESEKIVQQNVPLQATAVEVGVETQRLLSQEKAAQDSFTRITTQLSNREEVVKQTIEKIASMGEAASHFSNNLQGVQQSQQVFSEAVNRFCLFVDESASVRNPMVELNNDHHNNFLAALRRENDETDAYIAEWQARRGGA